METRKLYYTDPYLRSFEAQAISVEGAGKRVYLDQTALYPTSGGQRHDLGTLNGVPVLEVVDEDDRIGHLLAAPVEPGPVRGEIDWQRRFDHMQQHTGQHLLSAVFVELFSIPTLSFHMGAETSTIELGTKELTEEAAARVESRCADYVREARPIKIEFSEADEVQGLRKSSARTGTLRIIDIEGVDRSACGGTHVRSTSEIGAVQIRRQEKIRGNVRIEFLCGERARRQARHDFMILNELAKLLAAPVAVLPEHVSQMRHRLALAEKENQRFSIESARREGLDLHATTIAMADGVRRVTLTVDAIDEPVRARAQAFTAGGHAILIAFAPAAKSVLLASSPDTGQHVGNTLRQVLTETGGRGGGSATLAQGSVSDPNVVQRLAAKLGFAS